MLEFGFRVLIRALVSVWVRVSFTATARERVMVRVAVMVGVQG